MSAREVALYPLVIGGVAILASIIGALSVRTSTDNVEGALYKGLIVSGLISAAAFYPITDWLMSDPLQFGVLDPGSALADASVTGLWLCGLIGIARHRGPVRDHRLLHVDPVPAGQGDRGGVADRSRDEHHPGPRPGLSGDGRSRRC